MINGAHVVIHSKEPDKLRELFRDALQLNSVDAGGGWLIFALPPAEVAVHPSDNESRHELYLMCDEIEEAVTKLQDRGIEIARPISDEGWGLVAAIRLPDGGELGLYEPRHPLPDHGEG